MNSMLQQMVEVYLQPTPAPEGMTSREIVQKAIEFRNPPRVPYSFIAPVQSDFFETAAIPQFLAAADPDSEAANLWVGEQYKKRRELRERYYDEWGVGLEVTGRGWDHPFDSPLRDLRKLADFSFPDVAAPEKFDAIQPILEQAVDAGKYVVGFDPIMMFERMRQLLGFEELMMAPYSQPKGLDTLLDRLTDMEIAVIEQWARMGGVDAYMTWDDWGLQTTLQVNPDTFRQYYKPRYARIVEAAHKHDMHYIWHNCGYIIDMIPDMIDLGVDVVQLDQQRLMGHERLADEFGGKLCFWNTVDIQWSTMENPSDDEIEAEVAEMMDAFNRFGGGIMARQYPQPADIGMPYERHIAISEAFLRNGCAL
jgi:hypothetical protein